MTTDQRLAALEEELAALQAQLSRSRWLAPLKAGFPATEVRDILPAAAVEFAYQIVTIRGTPDRTYQCLRTAGGTWAWLDLGLDTSGPSGLSIVDLVAVNNTDTSGGPSTGDVTMSSLAIETTEWFEVIFQWHRTGVAAQAATLTFKLNGTTIINAIAIGAAAAAAESGVCSVLVPPYVSSNYARNVMALSRQHATGTGAGAVFVAGGTTDRPNAQITSIAVALGCNVSDTIRIDNIRVLVHPSTV